MDIFVRILARVVTRKANLVPGGMPRVVMVQTADNRPFVHDRGRFRQHIRQLNPGNRGRNRAELASIFDRGIWLWVPHVDVTRPTAHPQDNDGPFLIRICRNRFLL